MKIAVLGTGSAGCRHLKAIGSIPGVEPVAVPVRSSRLAELEEQGLSTAASLEEAAAGGVKAAVIATDTSRHVEDVLCALEHGLHVMVEKPMAVNAPEAQRIWERTSQLDRMVYVGCVLRFSESLNTFRELLSKIGRLHSVQVFCGSYLPDWRPTRPYRDSYSAKSKEGGVLRDLVHDIDYTGWLFGWPSSTAANVKNLGRLDIDADEIADLRWETPTGGLVAVSLDFLSRPPRRQLVASGEWGTIKWDGIKQVVTLKTNRSDTGANTIVIHSVQTREHLFKAQGQAFVNALLGDFDSRLATGADGIKALAVCDAARRASESRREEPVGYP